MENATEVPRSSPARICKRPGCTTELGMKNKSGKCSKHFHWNETAKARPSSGNGHAPARGSGANGHAPTAGDRPRDLIASRLDRVFASMTIADKEKIAAAWLRGEI